MLTQPKKDSAIFTRCTKSEREVIIARAQRAGKSLSAYVLGAALHYATPGAVQVMSAGVRREPISGTFLPKSADGKGGA